MQDYPTLSSISTMLAQSSMMRETMGSSIAETLVEHRSMMEEIGRSPVMRALAEQRSVMQEMARSHVTATLGEHRSLMQQMTRSPVLDTLAEHRSLMQEMARSQVTTVLAEHRSVMDEIARSSISETLSQYRSISQELSDSSVVRSLFENRQLIQEARLTFRASEIFGDTRSSISDTIKASLEAVLWPDQLLQNLKRVSAREFVDRLEEPQNSPAMNAWGEVAAAKLGLSPPVAEMLSGLVDEEFSAVGAVVEKLDAVVLDTIALFDILLALLARLGDLGRHPKVQAFVIQLLIASIPTVGFGIWQSKESDKQHAEKMAVLTKIAEEKEESKDNHHLRAIVVRPKAHLRAKPTAKSESLGMLQAGDEILILGRSNGWLLVRAGMVAGEIRTGWVYGQLVKAIV